jgi:hypothetical protein
MFILYAVPIGIVAGLLVHWRLDRLGELRLRWAPLAALGLVAQLALFVGPFGNAMGDAAPALYVASTIAVFVAVLRNVTIPGMALVAVGAGGNLAAILANGGYMPADAAAFGSLFTPAPGYSNSVVSADPALRPLTDIYALPAAFPLANVFSVGDVLIGIGLALTIALAMRPGARSVTGQGVD